MQIEIVNPAIEARLRKQLQATGASSVEEVLQHLLETQEAQDDWLLMNGAAVDAKIRRGIEQLDRGEGIPEDELDGYLAKRKAQGDGFRPDWVLTERVIHAAKRIGRLRDQS